MNPKYKGITIIGYSIIIVLILTNFEGLDINKLLDKDYMYKKYLTAKTVIQKQIERID